MAMILRLIAGTSLAVLLLAGGTSAGGELKSSLPVGSGLRGAFYPKFVAGPGTGGRYCPV